MKLRAVLACVACSLFADVATAGEPSSSPSSSPSSPPPQAPPSPLVDKASSFVRERLVQRMVAREKKRSPFSRSPPAAAERRVRILDAAPANDAQGRGFVRFALDERWSRDDPAWSNDSTTGCVYVDDGAVFIDVGDAFVDAGALFGDARVGDEGGRGPCRPAAPGPPPPRPGASTPSTTNG